MFWNSISNRTTDRIDALENRVSGIDGKTESNSQRLEKDEAWISQLITARMDGKGK